MMNPRFVAVDLGGTRVRVALAGDELILVARREERTDHSAGPESVLAEIARLVNAALQDAGVSAAHISRVVVASPGPLNGSTGVVFSPPNMPGWGEVALGAELEDRLHMPVTIVNDANAAAVGEMMAGAGSGCKNVVYLTVSTGIGAGVIIDGNLLEGASGAAGEIGHMTVDLHGPICNCGNIGCLEALASGTGIACRFSERLAAGARSSVTSGATAAEIAAGAAAGDETAASVVNDAYTALAFGVVNCIHIFNPDIVIIGGGVVVHSPQIFGAINVIVAQYALPVARAAARVVPAALGEDAGLVGAAATARETAT